MIGERQIRRLRQMSGVAMLVWGLASCIMFVPDLMSGRERQEMASFDEWLFLLFGVYCLIGGVVTLRQR
jgi:hypothetical protein